VRADVTPTGVGGEVVAMATAILGVVLYSFLQEAGLIGEDGSVSGPLQSTKTVRRLSFGAADFTALTMGVQVAGKRNRSLLASSDRETSSANSWIDASNVRTRARVPTRRMHAPISIATA